nr:Do family serine endopeptidase [Desulfosarcina widdelii]
MLKRFFYSLAIIFTLTAQNGFCDISSRENNVVKAVRQNQPAVVNISSEYEIRKNSNPFSGYRMDPMLEKFFRDFFSPEFERREKRTSLGSGVIIDGELGFVLTNNHVIEKATSISVTLNDKREFEAAIVGMDPDSDLAVLKIKSDGTLPSIQMGNSDDIMIGESVIAIGNPFGFSHTVTTGVISAVNRSLKSADRIYHEFIQTDASINPGNSGGPLLNIDGELIGINTAIYAEAQGIGFAIPINRAKRIVSDLIHYGSVVQAWIGLTVQPIDASLSAYLNLENNQAVIVSRVTPGSPAEEAGLKESDVIHSIDDTTISNISDYRLKLKRISSKQTISVGLTRQGKKMNVRVNARPFPIKLAPELTMDQLGIAVADLDTTTRSKYHIAEKKGVLIVKMQRGSYLDRIGVQPGDIIRRIDEESVDNLSDFNAAIVKYRSKYSIVLLIQREGQLYPINAIMRESQW